MRGWRRERWRKEGRRRELAMPKKNKNPTLRTWGKTPAKCTFQR